MARTSSGQLGASLLETLIASALAGFLALLLIKFYQLSVGMRQQSSERLELMNTLMSADHLLHDSLHLASTGLCGPNSVRQSLVRPINDLSAFAEEVSVSSPKRLRNRRYQLSGNLLTAHKTGPPYGLARHDKSAQRFILREPSPFSRGDLLVVCDSKRTVLVQISASGDDGMSLSYRRQARVLPGNCRDIFVSCHCGCDHTFDERAIVALYQPLLLFVSPRPDSAYDHALFRSYLVIERSNSRLSARLHSEELVSGIAYAQAMLSYGESGFRQLNYGIVMPAPHTRQPDKAVYLFSQDVSSLLPASHKEQGYYSYEFSFSL